MRFYLRGVFVLLLFLCCFCEVRAQYDLNKLQYEARILLSKNKFTEAIQKLDLIIAYKDNDFDLYFLRGYCKFNLEDVSGAMADFNSSIGLNPYNPDTWRFLGLCKERFDDYEGAIYFFTRAISIDTNNAMVYASRAEARLNIHKYCDCIDDCEKALKFKNQNPEGIVLCKAICEESAGEYEASLSDYGKVLNKNPFDPSNFVRRAMVKQKLNRIDEAREDFHHALKLDSNSVFALFNLGIMEMELENSTAAITYFTKVVNLDPRNSLAFFNRAVALSRIKKYAAALQDLNSANNISEDNLLILMLRASINTEQHHLKEALADYDRAIILFPYSVPAFYERAQVKQLLGDLKGAYVDNAAAKSIGEMNRFKTPERRSADSLTHARLIRFKGGFDDNQTSLGRVQNVQTEIRFLPPFRVCQDDTSHKTWFSLELANFNRQNSSVYRITNSNGSPVKHKFSDNLKLKMFDKAISYTDTGSHSKADSLYRQLLQSDSNFVFARFNLATSLCVQQQLINNFELNPDVKYYEEALNELKKALKISPSFIYGYFNKAYVCTYLHDYKSAIEAYSRCIQLNPDFAEAHFNLGLLFLLLKDKEDAGKELSKAGELGIQQSYSVIKKFCN